MDPGPCAIGSMPLEVTLLTVNSDAISEPAGESCLRGSTRSLLMSEALIASTSQRRAAIGAGASGAYACELQRPAKKHES